MKKAPKTQYNMESSTLYITGRPKRYPADTKALLLSMEDAGVLDFTTIDENYEMEGQANSFPDIQ
jgi:hypothetical protein